MKRAEYMNKLSEALEIFGADVKAEIMEDYEEHYEIGLQNGKSEEQISDELGEIEELVKELRKSESVMNQSWVNETKENVNEENMIHPDSDQNNESQANNNMDHNQEFKSQVNDTWENDFQKHNDEKSQEDKGNLPRNIEVRSKFAYVEVVTSDDNQIHLDWVNYNESRAKEYYEFRSWVEGTTIYGDLCRKNIGSIFSMIFAQDVKIVVKIPKGFPELEINSMSGDTLMQDVEVQSVKVNSASGDIRAEHCIGSQMSLDTKSGDIICNQSKYQDVYMDTKSGDIMFSDIQSTLIHARSLSGDINGSNVSGDANLRTASGDIKVTTAFGKQFDISSISGDVKVEHLQGDTIKIATKSSDVKAEFCVENCVASSISGDINLMNARECSIQASSVSGSIGITCNGISGYQADIHTISGKEALSFKDRTDRNCGKGVFTYGTGMTKIKAKTTSGNIRVQG